MKIGIITTIYKAEKDLPRLLDSMMAQKSRELEFFLIDNGSPDRCGEICRSYASRDDRFILNSLKENIGYIGARNWGLRECKTEYIGFCDSDDYLEPGGYDRAVELIREYGCDLFMAGWNTISGNSTVNNTVPFSPGLYGYTQINDKILPCAFGPTNECGFLQGFAWKMIYRRAIVEEGQISFLEKLKPYEDQIFNIDVLRRIKKVYVDNVAIYNYIVNDQSITVQNAKKFLLSESWKRTMLLHAERMKRVSNEEEKTAAYNSLALSLYSNVLQTTKSIRNSREAAKQIKTIIGKDIPREVKAHYTYKGLRYRLTVDSLAIGFPEVVVAAINSVH